MLDAIELAGLKPLALIDDGSAGKALGHPNVDCTNINRLHLSGHQLRDDENISLRSTRISFIL